MSRGWRRVRSCGATRRLRHRGFLEYRERGSPYGACSGGVKLRVSTSLPEKLFPGKNSWTRGMEAGVCVSTIFLLPFLFFFLSFFSLSFCRSTTVEFHWISLSLSLRFSPLVFRYSSRFSFTSVFLVGDRICFLFYPVIYLMFRHESLSFFFCKEIHRREIILFEPLLISRQKYLSKMRERSGFLDSV